jgi:hypothetical protein
MIDPLDGAPHIKLRLPKREWLPRCVDNDQNLSMCSICVTADNTIIGLDRSQIAEFHYALQSAIELADADLATGGSGMPDR